MGCAEPSCAPPGTRVVGAGNQSEWERRGPRVVLLALLSDLAVPARGAVLLAMSVTRPRLATSPLPRPPTKVPVDGQPRRLGPAFISLLWS
jgi:hypothetical protein